MKESQHGAPFYQFMSVKYQTDTAEHNKKLFMPATKNIRSIATPMKKNIIATYALSRKTEGIAALSGN